MAERSAEQIMDEREAMICKIEEAGAAMRASGLCDEWLRDKDCDFKAVVGQANGPLLSALLDASGFSASSCVDVLRTGMHAHIVSYTFRTYVFASYILLDPTTLLRIAVRLLYVPVFSYASFLFDMLPYCVICLLPLNR